MIDFLLHRLDDVGLPLAAALCIAWAFRRGRWMTKQTPLIDVAPVLCIGMGAAGIIAEYVKWVDIGQWPMLLVLIGVAGWNGLPPVREALAKRLNPSQPVARALRHALGIR